MSKVTRLKNAPLLFGLLIVSFTLILAFAGPSLAPYNPLEGKIVLEVDGEWQTAPFPPFRVPEHPLGTDSLGRDVLSQILWALRPTLLLVGYVALIRLLLGTTLGILAGWNKNAFGFAINDLINAALSMPSLVVALAVVALAGSLWQPWSFVLGLSLTGWADSARLVREQTRITREQTFIEASRALGQSNFGIVFNHILRQILPFIWMLLAFEISATLLTTAGLGFLGYYTGGEVWVWISDTEAARYSGMPELGQMLSGVNEDIYTSPWKLFSSGTLVFISVLGFNLLGEGLRRVALLGTTSSALFIKVNRLRWYISDHFIAPIKKKLIERPLASTAIFIITTIALIMGAKQIALSAQTKPSISLVPRGHLWGSQSHDPSATLWTNAPGVKSPQLLWQFSDGDGFPGGPAVAVDGSVYLLSEKGKFYSLSLQGDINWSVSINADGVGSPALDAQGNIYLTDAKGSLHSFTPAGELRWTFQPTDSFEATSGPVVSASGVAYYLVIGDLYSISPDGELLWRTTVFNRRSSFVPAISPDERLIFLRSAIVEASTGLVTKFESLSTTEQNIVGLNGLFYSRFENKLTGWEYINGEAQLRHKSQWSHTAAFGFPGPAGVLPDGSLWLHFNSDNEDSALLWLDRGGDLLNRARLPYHPSMLVGIDEDFVFYICGSTHGKIQCAALPRGAKNPQWTFDLEAGDAVSGAALVPERLYIATRDGHFYAIGNFTE